MVSSPNGTFYLYGPPEVVQQVHLLLTPDYDACADNATGTSLAVHLRGPPGSTALTPLSTLQVRRQIPARLSFISQKTTWQGGRVGPIGSRVFMGCCHTN